ncbi:MAG: T9SS type A sorting domain-containing protein [Melioribacteraceae bacterium]|nr:T9SS type A sorting domain-containing protein [Melioribacteraceae bacterium]MCF8356191.1 T9SS type A sorting domain-containing protein [Melioribacteraceae bacterium]MCF8394689.1 T9SS type A sorting domain-containing protein [Melioribacteraceae bacterium]MCF8420233.1 T9SS type A sorting domain-containing protein [Melioribacteraceae bacterium]
MKKKLTLTIILLIGLLSNNIYSQWSVDPTVNNPICTQANTQEYPAITDDGSGGAIITWDDNRDGNFNIYAQKINSSAALQWSADGLAVCTQASSQYFASITSDGSGGAIITWQDSRNGNPSIYAQRINASGAVQWTADGVAISINVNGENAPSITGDGSGGAIITWYTFRNGNNDIYAQSIDASGAVQWTANGLPVCTQASHQQAPTITSDGSSGAIITWYDNRTGNQDIYAQRINSSGATLWTTAAAGGVNVCTNISRQDNPTITIDGSGGAIITWFDGRAGNNDIYAQRINRNGAPQWTADGLPVCTLTSDQYSPDISSDGSGGAIITWNDARNSTFYDIYAQRINSSGAAQWTADGIAISTVGGKATLPVITGDASGGIITWQDSRNVSIDIYASKASPDGALPVELTTFTAELNENIVELNWETATEVNNYGFEIQRQVSRIEYQDWEVVGFVQGHGTTNSPKEYSFIDSDLPDANVENPANVEVSYRLKQIDLDGKYEYYNTIAQVTLDANSAYVNQIPREFTLYQNYPNPFNPATTIRFSIASASTVTITVSNLLGQLVMELVNDIRSAGNHEITFNANNLATGVYLYKINAVGIDGKTNFASTRKMILMK